MKICDVVRHKGCVAMTRKTQHPQETTGHRQAQCRQGMLFLPK